MRILLRCDIKLLCCYVANDQRFEVVDFWIDSVTAADPFQPRAREKAFGVFTGLLEVRSATYSFITIYKVFAQEPWLRAKFWRNLAEVF